MAHRCSGGAGSGRHPSCEACNVRLTAPQSRLVGMDLSGAQPVKLLIWRSWPGNLALAVTFSVAHVRPAAPDRDCDQSPTGRNNRRCPLGARHLLGPCHRRDGDFVPGVLKEQSDDE